MPNYDGAKFCALQDEVQGASAGALCRWLKKEPLTYLFANPWPRLAAEDVARAFRLAFDRWEAVCDLKFQLVNAGPADITIYSRRLDGAGKVLAEAQLQCPPGNAKLWARFDDSEDYIIADNPPANKIDLTRVACHEIGHLLGMGHISGPNLMAPHYSVQIREPQVGDISEAVARYGVKPQEPSEPPGPPSGSDDYVLLKIPREWVVEPEDE